MKSQYTKEQLEKIIPVFHLKPESSSRVKSILTMYATDEERLCDDQLSIETPENIKQQIGDNTLLLGQMNSYVIVGKYCACNIPGDYLVNNSKIPVYYLSIIYNKQFVTGALFNIFVYFEMSDETKKKLNEPKKYYKAFMNGKFTLQVVPSDDNFMDKVKEYVEKDVLLKYQKEIDDCKEDEEKDKIMEKIINEINGEIKSYCEFMEPQDFGDRVPTQKAAFKRLNPFCDSPILKKMLSYGLLYREKERIESRGIDEDIYKIPQNVIKLDDVKNYPEKLGELLARKKEGIDSDDERC